MENHDSLKSFDLDKMSITLGHGLANMQLRGRSIGDDVDILSESGEAMTLFDSVPRGART